MRTYRYFEFVEENDSLVTIVGGTGEEVEELAEICSNCGEFSTYQKWNMPKIGTLSSLPEKQMQSLLAENVKNPTDRKEFR